jgi:hypothetical protein
VAGGNLPLPLSQNRLRGISHNGLYVQRVVMLKAPLVRWIPPAQRRLWQCHVQHNQRPSVRHEVTRFEWTRRKEVGK